MNDDLRKVRELLINLAKSLPFIICFILLVSYSECTYAFLANDFVVWGDCMIANKPITWAISEYFEYNDQMLFVLVIMSFAMRTCIYNKLACAYLFFNLLEKSFFDNHECDINIYYFAIIINITITAYFTYKGIRLWARK